MEDFLDKAYKFRDTSEQTKLVFRAEAALRSVYANASLDLRNIESFWNVFEMLQLTGILADFTEEEIAALPAQKIGWASNVSR